MNALEIPSAFAEVAVLVGEAIAVVLARPLSARIDDHLLTAATAGPTSVADARGDAICCHAAAVTAMNAGAVIDSLAAVAATPSGGTHAGGYTVAAIDASTIAAVRLRARVEDVTLANETQSVATRNVVPAVITAHLLQATLAPPRVVRHGFHPTTLHGLA